LGCRRILGCGWMVSPGDSIRGYCQQSTQSILRMCEQERCMRVSLRFH
jgi:hypothetical protein